MLSDLQVPTRAALLRSPRLFAPSVEGGEISLTAAGTTENACTADKRKLGCTGARYAERQRVIEVHQIVSHHQWRRAKQCRHAGHFHSPGAAPLRAAICQCSFLWVGLREGYLFFKKRYPSLAQRPFKARRTHRTQWGVNYPAVLTDALTHAVSAQRSAPSVGGPKGRFFSKDTVRYLTERRC